METEYVALSTSCKDLFPIINITTKLCHALNTPLHNDANLQVKIHEDESGGLILGFLNLVKWLQGQNTTQLNIVGFVNILVLDTSNLSKLQQQIILVTSSQKDSGKPHFNICERNSWDGNSLKFFWGSVEAHPKIWSVCVAVGNDPCCQILWGSLSKVTLGQKPNLPFSQMTFLFYLLHWHSDVNVLLTTTFWHQCLLLFLVNGDSYVSSVWETELYPPPHNFRPLLTNAGRRGTYHREASPHQCW